MYCQPARSQPNPLSKKLSEDIWDLADYLASSKSVCQRCYVYKGGKRDVNSFIFELSGMKMKVLKVKLLKLMKAMHALLFNYQVLTNSLMNDNVNGNENSVYGHGNNVNDNV